MPLVLFNTLSDKFLMKFLGKLLDEATVEFACLMYKNKGKMFWQTKNQAIDENFFSCSIFSYFFFFFFLFQLMKMLKM